MSPFASLHARSFVNRSFKNDVGKVVLDRPYKELLASLGSDPLGRLGGHKRILITKDSFIKVVEHLIFTSLAIPVEVGENAKAALEWIAPVPLATAEAHVG
jgi:hypothetical protein